MSSAILMTAAAPPFASFAMEQGHCIGKGSVVESHPEAALWPALVLLCCSVCRMLMHSTYGSSRVISAVHARNTLERNWPYGESAEMLASAAARATT
eukprot:4987616-Heterocapsa_arctica.AAC.1